MGRYLADVEDIIADQPEETKDILRARVTNNITNYFQFTETTGVLTHHQIINETKNIVRADKGSCTVVMDEDKYVADTK
ncbi:hypothetical protein WA026_012365 [Henosepilachna vigintioctopunctata]|uniref:Uncharacterized protein n=1 Tax=Henosepilachna vigintioctopunctata TaxID=420089 RepID=A0AAW1UYM4_9CUCU